MGRDGTLYEELRRDNGEGRRGKRTGMVEGEIDGNKRAAPNLRKKFLASGFERSGGSYDCRCNTVYVMATTSTLSTRESRMRSCAGVCFLSAPITARSKCRVDHGKVTAWHQSDRT